MQPDSSVLTSTVDQLFGIFCQYQYIVTPLVIENKTLNRLCPTHLCILGS